MIDHGQGNIFVLEHKTTSQLGNYYFNQFRPNNQITGYCWAASELSGRKVRGAIVNAIGVFKSGPTRFEREITMCLGPEIDEWKQNLIATASELEWHRKRGIFPMRTTACTLYGRCEYYAVHTLTTENERRKMLETDFILDPWDYEKRT